MKRSRETDGKFRNDTHTWITGCGEIIKNVHDRSLCEGRPCVVHAPSDHSMRGFRTHFRSGLEPGDIKPPHVERICSHGIGHPDPDDLTYQESVGNKGLGIHGCDGCCG